MSNRDTLSILAEELASVFSPLLDAVSSPESFTSFALELGWDLTQIPQPIKNLAAPLQSIASIVQAGQVDAASAAGLITAISSLVTAIEGIKNQPASAFPATVDANQFKSKFPGQLVDFLVSDYLLRFHPGWGELCRTLGVIRTQEVAASGLRPAYVKQWIAWSDLAKVLDDPFGVLKNAYGWGQTSFKAEDLVSNVAELAAGWGMEYGLKRLGSGLETFLTAGATALEQVHDWALDVPILEDTITSAGVNVGVALYMLPNTAADKPGFAVLPYGSGEFAEEIELTDTMILKIEGGMDLAGGVAILVRPGKLQVLVDILQAGGKPPSSGALAVAIQKKGSSGSRILVVGSEGGSRFDIGLISVKAGTRLGSTGKNDLFAEAELKDAKIVIDPGSGEADSFLSSLLPKSGLTIDFSLLMGFGASQGFYFGGSGGLEVKLPAHLQVGPIEISAASLAIKPSGGIIPLDLGATIKGNLGPLKAVVEDIGLRAKFSFPGGSKGNLGPANLSLAFLPPKGVGLSLDAGVVKGGGYLYLDHNKGEYAGALQLVFAEFIDLKAIGLINTKMPDGSSGFSLLIIITAEFGAGIQLGYGFVLLGVGGLVGLNRTVRLKPLMEGVRTGSVNNIMFPKDVVANAPRIISDLRTIFPPKKSQFLIGPMAKLGYGTPALITLSLGIIIEIPGNLAILGVLKVALPAEQAPLILLQVNFAGAIEFSKKRLYFFASLFESRVVSMTIDGEMGLLMAWGADADFVVSVGGFHPQFNPPPLPFPSPKRIALTILNRSNARIQVKGYFAVTSNTAQFGARAELYFGFSACNISGHIGFDALIQFSPFYFIVQISGSVSLKVFGIGLFSIRLRMSLEGPAPWRAKGSGSISFLFFSISVDFDITWGKSRDTSLPPIEVMPLLTTELGKLANWTAQLPASNKLLISLKKPTSSTELVLHPVGTLRISQKAIPLDLTIAKVGNRKVKDVKKLSVSAAGGLSKKRDTTESFAMAQYQEMEDTKKLSRAAYEQQHSGLEVSVQGQQLTSSRMVKRIVRYETVIIDSNYKRFVLRFFVFWKGLFAHFLKGATVAQSTLSFNHKTQMQPFPEKIEVLPEQYTVALQSTNRAFSPESAGFASQAQAREYMLQQIQSDANLTEQLHVIPIAEEVS